jgi:hypothetical protein
MEIRSQVYTLIGHLWSEFMTFGGSASTAEYVPGLQVGDGAKEGLA